MRGIVTKLGIAVLAGYAASRLLNRSRFEFAGATVLISGGSRGLGLVLARQLCELGANVILIARDPDRLQAARRQLNDFGFHHVRTEACDITDKRQVEALFERLSRDGVAIDVLINNAGVIQTGPVETMTSEDYEESIATHVYGPLNLINAVTPAMKHRGGGRIVNVASIGGVVSVPHLVPYCTGKFALVGLSLGLRSELAKNSIVVSTVCPGLTRTGSPRNAYFKGQHRLEYAWFKVSDSLPGISMDAESAAERIIQACAAGEAFVVLSVPAKVAALLYSMFPGAGASALGLVNRLLPSPGGIGRERLPGRESESAVTRSPLTSLTQRAAAQNNEM